ncbi:hypothetical protein HG536_0A06600 [Torulaspora globosa]|uniref:BRO domain-containing protein 1 n=1 Tax=Torulaspora globosa TaxID=48254 RepID=A0A7G3ZBF9_9SACH|nr:uncharacterized protein HG536_0A06600 [Torulaspora globosa]QLL30845.1 hypothetical protein HG536_0A06600 [Torulaspora globosa]
MRTYLLELKSKDTEPIDWKKGLASYLRRSYGSGQWSQFYNEKLADEFDRLRNNANGELAPEALLEQNLVYYAFLEHLHLRLGNNSGQLKLDFTWYEAEYSGSGNPQKCSQHNLVLEKSCTLFNIGVLYTQVARAKLSGDLKESVSYLSKAVASFRFLSENFLNSPSADLQAENTEFLADVAHAEAQELFVLRLINGTDPAKQASLISKLAYAVANLNERCSRFYEEAEENATGYGETKWRAILKCKVHFYKAVTAYYYAIFLEQQSKYGDALAFLKVAKASLISSLIYKSHLADFIDFQSFKESVEIKEKQISKDNDYIYHDIVPQTVELEAVKSMDAIKSPDWPKQLDPYMEQVASKCDVLFKGIVPIEIYERESIYSEEKATFLRKKIDASETANWEYASFVEFTNLPKLLADLEARYKSGSLQGMNNPELDLMKEQLGSWSNAIKSSPFKNIDDQMGLIVSKRREILDMLPLLSSAQKENIVKLKAALVEASKSDERLFSLVKPYVQEINLLKDDVVLWKKFNSFSINKEDQPSLLDVDDSKVEKILEKLRSIKQLAEDLKLLKEERSRNLGELKEALNKDDITKILLLHGKKMDTELKQVFESEMEKFQPFGSRIEATIFKQTSTINDIKFQLDEVFKLSGFQNTSKLEMESFEECKGFVDKLNVAFENFGTFCNDLPKGLAFYDSLLKMSRDLLVMSQAEANNNQTGPSNEELLSTGHKLQKLSISDSQPEIPPRTYAKGISSLPAGATPLGYQSPGAWSSNSPQSRPSVPPVPPKPPASFVSKPLDYDEQELQKNPTSFYNKPSVFDENLYSKFSG